MIIDVTGSFAASQSLSGTSDTVSSNVYDAGNAKKVWAGGGGGKIFVTVSAVGGTNPTFRARFVGADDAALTTNPEILDDTGVSKVLAAADLPWVRELRPNNQQVAKRYYGVMFTQAGTSPTATASANLVLNPQTNLIK